MLDETIAQLMEGIKINKSTLKAKVVWPSRIPEEKNYELLLDGKHLLYLKAYTGGKPNYSPWIEVFGINPEGFIDTLLEGIILKTLADSLPPKGKIFVEYIDDPETEYGLKSGFPPAASRLGNLLFNLGFTWFKDWYFAEGGKEGNQKLGAEKPLDDELRQTQISAIMDELKVFLDETKAEEENTYLQRARDRAKSILNHITS